MMVQKADETKLELKLSLAEWSLHKTYLMANDQSSICGKSQKSWGLRWQSMYKPIFKDKAENTAYLDSPMPQPKAERSRYLLRLMVRLPGEADSVRRDSAVNAHKMGEKPRNNHDIQ